jgi:hypothetical protein
MTAQYTSYGRTQQLANMQLVGLNVSQSMPGNLQQAAPNGVTPASLCTAFTELREDAQLQNQYHDGTIQRAQLVQTSRRTFGSASDCAPVLSTLYNFWVSQSGGLNGVRVLQTHSMWPTASRSVAITIRPATARRGA